MAVQPLSSPKFRAFTASGQPLAGGKLYAYAAGTSTPLATYTTRAGTVANPSPVVLDANGEADVWLTPSTLYKFELRSSTEVVQWTVDNFPAPPDSAVNNSFSAGITVTQSAANTQAVQATGTGTGPGVAATGGGTSGTGVSGTGGAPNGAGVAGTGAGTGPGVAGVSSSTAGANVYGVYGRANNNGVGVYGYASLAAGTPVAGIAADTTGEAPFGLGVGGVFAGAGSALGVAPTAGTGVFAQGAVGAHFAANVASTAAARTNAMRVERGDILFSSLAAPSAGTAMANRLTAHNTLKAWVSLTTAGGGSTAVTIHDGYNVSGASVSAGTLTVTLAAALAGANYAVLVTSHLMRILPFVPSQAVGSFDVTAWSLVTAAAYSFQADGAIKLSILVFGAQ